jgi:hydrogenase-4 component B
VNGFTALAYDLVPLAFATRFVAIALALALARRAASCRVTGLAGSMFASLLVGVTGAAVALGGAPVQGLLLGHRASGLSFGYAVAPLAAWFLVVLATLAVPAALYSLGYLAHAVPAGRTPVVVVGFNVLLGAVEAVFVADGVVTFLFAWELMTLATAALVATEHETPANRRAALVFLAMSHVGTGCLVAGFLTLASLSGSLAFPVALAGGLASGGLRDLLFVLFLVGFGVKAGVVPLHVWLPEAHPAAPSSVSALMSGVLITTGLYGIVRVCVFGLGPADWDWGVTLVAVGSLSGALGVLYALAQSDLKVLLAYSTIENAGLVLLGLGAGTMALASGRGELAAVGIAASLYHVLNHAVFKGLLFLGAGGVVMATGTRQLEELGGLTKRMPWTACFFLVGAAAISGLPLLNGFASEWLLFQALLFGFHVSSEILVRFLFPVAGALLALTSALAAACFVKAFGITFLARPRGAGAREARESPRVMLVPQAFLAALCFALGLLPGWVLGVLQRVTASLPGVTPAPEMARGLFAIAPGPGRFDHLSPLLVALPVLAAIVLALALAQATRYTVRRAPSWGCGGELTEHTEYTATAFSKPLMLIFAAIYRPTREVSRVEEVSAYFPSAVRYRAEIEPTFERFVYGPITRGVLGLAERMKVVQAGSLHAYLAYVLFLGIALLLWLGGNR